MGPDSRALLQAVSDVDCSNTDFPINSVRHFQIGRADVFALRLSFSGELGWEIFISPDFAEYFFEILMEAGENLNLRLIGDEALNALRLEKGYLLWGHDISYTHASHQLGLDFNCKTNKPTPFIGCEAYLARRAEGQGSFLCSIRLDDPKPLLHRNEPVLRDGTIVGHATSGAWGYSIGAAVDLCMLAPPKGMTGRDSVARGNFTVLVKGESVMAHLSTTQLYDAACARMLMEEPPHQPPAKKLAVSM